MASEWAQAAWDDDTPTLASRLGVGVAALTEAIGHGWGQTVLNPGVRETSGCGEWFVAGEPMQIMIRVTVGRVEVAVPDVTWDGPGEPRIVPLEQPTTLSASPVDLNTLGRVVAACAEQAQQLFIWCGSCHRPVGLGHEFSREPPLCQGCASRDQGVVF